MRIARIAGAFYLLTFVAGLMALALRNPIAESVAGAAYVIVTILFYVLFAPVNRALSAFAMLLSLAGCAVSAVTTLHIVKVPIQPLVFFGFYCLTIGYLVFRSGFLPRALGALMAFGGCGWLLFLWPSLARALTPWVFLPGIIGEGALTLWLLLGPNHFVPEVNADVSATH